MDTAIGTFQADEEAAITATGGEVKPIHIFSLARREIDDNMVAELVEVLTRHGGFLHPIAVRVEGPAQYRLISGHHRLEAWKHCFGEQRPIPASIYPSHTPDALITMLETQENLFRKELTVAEREAEMLRLAAALKKLDGEKSATQVSDLGEATETGNQVPRLATASGGRGNKGVTQKVAEKTGITKRGVRKRVKMASAAIGETIDLDLDTPEELERKADKRLHAEPKPKPKVERRKRSKPAPDGAIEDPTRPADSPTEEIGRQIEDLWGAFGAISRIEQLRFIHDACLRLGLDPLKMATPAAFELADEEPDLAVDQPAQVALATDDAVAEVAEQGDEVAVAQAKEEEEAALAQADQGDDGAESSAEDLQDTSDHHSEVGDEDPDLAWIYRPRLCRWPTPRRVRIPSRGDDAADLGTEKLQDASDDAADAVDLGAEGLQDADDRSEPGDQEPGGAMKCAYCTMDIESGEQYEMIDGRLYHRDLCIKHAKPVAIAAE